MLVATWIITFVLIIRVGIYAGTKITSSSQWSGGDKTMGAFAIGAVLGAWQIGGMSIVGAPVYQKHRFVLNRKMTYTS